jgi:hypothetical protein
MRCVGSCIRCEHVTRKKDRSLDFVRGARQHLHAPFACPRDGCPWTAECWPNFFEHRGQLFRRIGVELRMFYALRMYVSYGWCMFHLDVACVSSRYCKSKSSVAYVAIGIHVCWKCRFQRFSYFRIVL